MITSQVQAFELEALDSKILKRSQDSITAILVLPSFQQSASLEVWMGSVEQKTKTLLAPEFNENEILSIVDEIQGAPRRDGHHQIFDFMTRPRLRLIVMREGIVWTDADPNSMSVLMMSKTEQNLPHLLRIAQHFSFFHELAHAQQMEKQIQLGEKPVDLWRQETEADLRALEALFTTGLSSQEVEIWADAWIRSREAIALQREAPTYWSSKVLGAWLKMRHSMTLEAFWKQQLPPNFELWSEIARQCIRKDNPWRRDFRCWSKNVPETEGVPSGQEAIKAYVWYSNYRERLKTEQTRLIKYGEILVHDQQW